MALGILIMRFAATIFTYLIRQEPIFEPAAYMLILIIGLELALADLFSLHFDTLIKFLISLSILALCVLYARVKKLHILAPALYRLSQGMGLVNEWINMIFQPALVILTYLFRYCRRLLGAGDPISKQATDSPTD
jgi:tellurite resistance protein TerC